MYGGISKFPTLAYGITQNSKSLFYKKPLYKKPVPFAEKVAAKIRKFLGLILLSQELFGEIVCTFVLFEDNLAHFSPKFLISTKNKKLLRNFLGQKMGKI